MLLKPIVASPKHLKIADVIADSDLVHAQELSSFELPAMIADKRSFSCFFHKSLIYSMQPLKSHFLTH